MGRHSRTLFVVLCRWHNPHWHPVNPLAGKCSACVLGMKKDLWITAEIIAHCQAVVGSVRVGVVGKFGNPTRSVIRCKFSLWQLNRLNSTSNFCRQTSGKWSTYMRNFCLWQTHPDCCCRWKEGQNSQTYIYGILRATSEMAICQLNSCWKSCATRQSYKTQMKNISSWQNENRHCRSASFVSEVWSEDSSSRNASSEALRLSNGEMGCNVLGNWNLVLWNCFNFMANLIL